MTNSDTQKSPGSSVASPPEFLESKVVGWLTVMGSPSRTDREQARVGDMSQGRVEIDQYWRTRTINEAQLQGYSCLRLTCGCGRITDYPFVLLLQRRGVTRHSFIGNIRFRCKECGGKDITIGVRSQAPSLTR